MYDIFTQHKTMHVHTKSQAQIKRQGQSNFNNCKRLFLFRIIIASIVKYLLSMLADKTLTKAETLFARENEFPSFLSKLSNWYYNKSTYNPLTHLGNNRVNRPITQLLT